MDKPSVNLRNFITVMRHRSSMYSTRGITRALAASSNVLISSRVKCVWTAVLRHGLNSTTLTPPRKYHTGFGVGRRNAARLKLRNVRCVAIRAMCGGISHYNVNQSRTAQPVATTGTSVAVIYVRLHVLSIFVNAGNAENLSALNQSDVNRYHTAQSVVTVGINAAATFANPQCLSISMKDIYAAR